MNYSCWAKIRESMPHIASKPGCSCSTTPVSRRARLLEFSRVLTAGVLLSVVLLPSAGYARMGETYDECVARYGEPVDVVEFDAQVSARLESDVLDFRIGYYSIFSDYCFYPTRIVDFKTDKWSVRAIFGREIIKKVELESRIRDANGESNVTLPWEGERAMAITFTKNDGSKLEKEEIASILAKQFEGPFGEGFPRGKEHQMYTRNIEYLENKIKGLEAEHERAMALNDTFEKNRREYDARVGIKQTQRALEDYTSSFISYKTEQQEIKDELFEKLKQGEFAIVGGQRPTGHRVLAIAHDEASVKFALSNGGEREDGVDLCLKAFKETKEKIQEELNTAAQKSSDTDVVSDLDETSGL